jgi:Zn-dependent metalloprotease
MNAWFVRILIVLGFVSGPFLSMGAQGASAPMDDPTAVDISLSYLQTQASKWGIRNAREEFRLRQVVRDALGQTHVRLDQVHQGVSVFGQQVIVHIDQAGTPYLVTGAYLAGIDTPTQAAITGDEARGVATQQLPGPLGGIPEVELVLYPQDTGVRLAYHVVLNDHNAPRRIAAFVDAITGNMLHSYDDLRTFVPSRLPERAQLPITAPHHPVQERLPEPMTVAAGLGHSLYSGVVGITTELSNGLYYLIDYSRGGLYALDMQNKFFSQGTWFSDTDNVWGNGTTSDRASAAVDAHFGAELTWDYYAATYGRVGIKGDGAGSLSRVHYRRRYNNATWNDSCLCMTYGDGDGTTFSPLVSLDVAGHEMAHGVTSATADLIYENQSGGLNEAMSDIFGTMVEYYAAARGVAKVPNYWIGEDIFTPGTAGDALRYMNNPPQDGHSIDTFANYADGIDVHLSSGIANNAFYLLAEGGTHRLGGVVTGIGRSAAEHIFYRALVVYMIPSETFSQARAHTLQAASDLFGAGSQQVISVGQAWSAVGVP